MPRSVSSAISPAGEIYLIGGADEYSFPPPTATLGNPSSQEVIYLSKVDLTGKPLYTIALRGSLGVGIFFDSASNIYLAGAAASEGFYATPGAYRSTPTVNNAGFICKLRALDGTPIYCTYLDINGFESGFHAVDAAGNVSIVAGFVAGGQAAAGSLNQGKNIYAAKLNATGTGLIYAATFGGSNVDYPDSAAIDSAGNLFITGQTYSPDFPTTPSAAVRDLPAQGQSTSFVVALNGSGTAFLYCTLGNIGEQGIEIAVDPSGDAQVLELAPNNNIFVRRYNADGSGILFETPLNTTWTSSVGTEPQMAIDDVGITTILGVTNSIAFPVVQPVESCQLTNLPQGYGQGVLVRLDNTGRTIESTYLQGPGAATFLNFTVNSLSGRVLVLYVIGSGTGELDLLTLAPQTSAPQIKLTCIGNAATFTGAPLAPGEIVSLFGTGIGPVTPATAQLGTDQHFPTLLSNTLVTVNGSPAPLLYVSNTQINAVLPFSLSPHSENQVCVSYAGTPTNCISSGALAAAPGIFLNPASVAPGFISGVAAAVNQDGTINSEENPAAVGFIVSLFVNGLGTTTPLPADGSLIPIPIPSQDLNVRVEVPNPDPHNPTPDFGEVVYAGPAPFEIAGLGQINIRISSASTNLVTLWVPLPDGTVVTSNTAFLWVKE